MIRNMGQFRLMLGLAMLAEEHLPPFLVSDITKRGDPAPVGKVRIWGFRNGSWARTEPVDAATVDWSRLLDTDRIEVMS